jgi:hypothetical protein
MGARPLGGIGEPEPDGEMLPPLDTSVPTAPSEILGWLALGALLVGLLLGALTFSRAGRPSLIGDEATYAMQAASLAWDLDLRYTRADFDRFVAQWGGPPDGVILQSRDGGSHITYGKPFLYAAVIAPFSRVSPVRGPLVANVLMLGVAAVFSARTLKRRLGGAAPVWVAVSLFGSVAFAYVYWIHAEIFLLAATACAFAVAYGAAPPHAPFGRLPSIYPGAPEGSSGRVALRWAIVGALLAIPMAFRPFYAALFVPLLFAIPRGRRTLGLGALATGALLVMALTSFVQWESGGDWNGYAGERRGFYQATGYPDVDFPPERWTSTLQHWGNTSWVQEGAFEPVWNAKLWGWNTIYFLIGRNIGVLPYFLPLLLGFLAVRAEGGRWLIPWAAAAAVVGFLLVRPFNFYGGGGAIGNRYFLPLYPALWFMAARPAKARTALWVAALAAPFLFPLWRSPAAYPIGEDGRYRHVSVVAKELLPYETTQSHIPGGSDAPTAQGGLWVKLLNENVERTASGWRVHGSGAAELLVGSPDPLTGIAIDFDRRAPARLRVGSEELRPTLLRPDGSISFDVDFHQPRAVHAMWWTHDDYYLYDLRFQLVGAPDQPIDFQILRERHLTPRREALKVTGGGGGAG